jgi:hypothetical protein
VLIHRIFTRLAAVARGALMPPHLKALAVLRTQGDLRSTMRSQHRHQLVRVLVQQTMTLRIARRDGRRVQQGPRYHWSA